MKRKVPNMKVIEKAGVQNSEPKKTPSSVSWESVV